MTPSRRGFLKGLGAAVGVLTALPWVSLTARAVLPTEGILMSSGLHHYTFYQGRLFALSYDQPQTIFSWREKQTIECWGAEVGRLIEEEMALSTTQSE